MFGEVFQVISLKAEPSRRLLSALDQPGDCVSDACHQHLPRAWPSSWSWGWEQVSRPETVPPTPFAGAPQRNITMGYRYINIKSLF